MSLLYKRTRKYLKVYHVFKKTQGIFVVWWAWGLFRYTVSEKSVQWEGGANIQYLRPKSLGSLAPYTGIFDFGLR